MNDFKKYINDVDNFPAEGVTFRDISPLLSKKFPEVIDAMIDLFSKDELKNFDSFAGIDARGFIFASALAARTNKNMIMLRKNGKLPPPTMTHNYKLEYGSSTLEIKNLKKQSLVIVDDVLATGGTLQAAANLCFEAKHDVKALITLIDLKYLNNFEWNGMTVKSLVQYHD